jgi:hypothetical protein
MWSRARKSLRWGVVVSFACAGLVAPGIGAAAWNEVVPNGSPSIPGGMNVTDAPRMAVAAGVPYVVWTEGLPAQVRVARLATSGTSWERVGTASLNVDPTRAATAPVIADVGGAPWVAWSESDGATTQIRVARMNASGTGFTAVGTGTSPVNVNAADNATSPSLASVGGVPHVAWSENDGVAKVRVARLGSGGSTWDDVGIALNDQIGQNATTPNIVDIGGVPWVAWVENDGINFEVRVARFTTGAWTQPEGGASPINFANDQGAQSPRVASIGGVPYVAWLESHVAVGRQARISRFSAVANDWTPAVGFEPPVNRNPNRDAESVSVASVGGAPYISWTEDDGDNAEVRVARLATDGTAWEEVISGASPVNISSTGNALHAELTAVGGIPWITWSEEGPMVAPTVRVGRLEPEFAPPSAIPTVNGTVGATLFGSVRTFGLPYQAGFTLFAPVVADTGLAPTSGDLALLQRDVSGLTPLTAITYRPFATAGVSLPRVLGPASTFTSLAAKTTQVAPPPPVERAVVTWVDRLLKTKAGTRIRLRYVSTRAGRSTLELRRGNRLVRRFRATPRAGLNAFTILAPTAGAYRLILTVTTPDAQSVKATSRLIVRKK